MSYDLVIREGTCISGGAIFAADVAIRNGKIAAIGEDLHGEKELSAKDKLVIPGAIDGHVHLGLHLPVGDTVDNMESGTRAAALGGVTTIIDFATPNDGQSLEDSFKERYNEASGHSCIDFGIHMSVLGNAVNEEQIRAMPALGVSSIKLYMNYKDRGWMAGDDVLWQLLTISKETGLRIEVHCENDFLISLLQKEVDSDPAHKEKYGAYAHIMSRPPITEWEAVQRAITWAEATGGHLYVVHMSTARSAMMVKAARECGIDVIGESCPQYFLLNDELYKRPDGYLYASCPPVRHKDEVRTMQEAIKAGAVDLLGTDTCAFNRQQKESWGGDYHKMAFGLPGVDLLLPLSYHMAADLKFYSLERWVDLIATNPAKIHGLPQKGALNIGKDADVVIFDPHKEITLKSGENMATMSDCSPYEGMHLSGWPVCTISHGQIIAQDGKFLGKFGAGHFLRRNLCSK